MDGGGDHQDGEEGGEVVPFPGGRHPSQWQGESPSEDEEADAVSAPLEESDQAAGDFEPLLEDGQQASAETYNLDSRRAAVPGVDSADPRATSDDKDAIEGDHLQAKTADALGDDGEFEDFIMGASSFDEFTGEDYIKATTQEYRGLADAMAEAATEDVEMQAVAAAMPGMDTGLVGFEDVTGEQPELALPEPRGPSDLSLRLVTGLVLVGLLIGALVLGGFWLWLFVLSAAIVALGEFYATVRQRGYAPVSLFGLLGGIGAFGAAYLADGTTPLAIAGATGMTLVATTFWYAVVPRRSPLVNAAITVFGMAWVTGLMAFAVPIILAPRFQELILALALVTGFFDIGSYFVGRAIGRIKLAKVLSPKKTFEGLLGGIVTALAVGAGLAYIDWFGFELREGLLLGAVVSLAAPLGDLAESMVKRALRTKDMGAILPGHGGLLDRIDSFIFSVPACYVLFLWLGFLA
ncbi:MAG: phosphatidate cytidylyltransferase [Acidimicrobiia bacterium]|nr:phosphatidate cytidylyltransferase [Acidimicrobiia bacterium]